MRVAEIGSMIAGVLRELRASEMTSSSSEMTPPLYMLLYVLVYMYIYIYIYVCMDICHTFMFEASF